MKKAPLLEIRLCKHERVERLVKEYSLHPKKELQDATLRISKRLGHQRTSKAIEAINSESWEEACLAMLDYYDKCYEHELKKVEFKTNCDVSGLNDVSSAKKLLDLGHVF